MQSNPTSSAMRALKPSYTPGATTILSFSASSCRSRAPGVVLPCTPCPFTFPLECPLIEAMVLGLSGKFEGGSRSVSNMFLLLIPNAHVFICIVILDVPSAFPPTTDQSDIGLGRTPRIAEAAAPIGDADRPLPEAPSNSHSDWCGSDRQADTKTSSGDKGRESS